MAEQRHAPSLALASSVSVLAVGLYCPLRLQMFVPRAITDLQVFASWLSNSPYPDAADGLHWHHSYMSLPVCCRRTDSGACTLVVISSPAAEHGSCCACCIWDPLAFSPGIRRVCRGRNGSASVRGLQSEAPIYGIQRPDVSRCLCHCKLS